MKRCATGQAFPEVLRCPCQILCRQPIEQGGRRTQTKFLGEVLGASLRGSAHIAEHDQLLTLPDQLPHQRDDYVLRAGLVTTLHDVVRG